MPEVTIRRGADMVGVICRGGPVNGPYAAGALATLKHELEERNVAIGAIYGNSAAASAAVMAAIHREDQACNIWASLRPDDLILPPNGWWGKARTVWNLLNAEAIFDGGPLERLIKRIMPLGEVFGENAIPVKVMAVDYLTGREVVASNRDPRHRWNFHNCVLGSKALTPFLKCQVIYDVVEAGLLDRPWTRVGPFADIAVLFDGGFADNLMFDDACRDGCTVVFVVDICGLALGPLTTYRWNHWAQALQRAFHVLVTANDNRRFHGVQRTNEVLAVWTDLARLTHQDDVPENVRRKMEPLIQRLDNALGLAAKHPVKTVLVDDPANSRPFDFASFTHEETIHLLSSGHQAALRALANIQVVDP